MVDAPRSLASAPVEVDAGTYSTTTGPWWDVAWRADALGWIEDRLSAAGRHPRGRLRVRLRPWSVVVRIPLAAHRPVWFKASPPGARFEAGLVTALARWAPGRVLSPIAVDAVRGWSIVDDGGVPLHRRPPDVRRWQLLLNQYARLQRDLVPRVDELLTLGVPDARTTRLGSVVERTLDELPAASASEHRWDDLRRDVRAAAEQLQTVGVPDTLDHADVHDAQVLVGPAGALTVFDWGDASVAHPFGSLRVPLERARELFGADALPGLRDAYLEPWSGVAPASELRRATRLAWRLATIARAGTWGRLFPDADPGADWRSEQVRWLRRFSEDPPPEL